MRMSFLSCHRLFQQDQRVLRLISLQLDVAKISQRLRMLGSMANSLFEFICRIVVLPRLPVQIAETKMQVGFLRRNLQRRLELDNGFLCSLSPSRASPASMCAAAESGFLCCIWRNCSSAQGYFFAPRQLCASTWRSSRVGPPLPRLRVRGLLRKSLRAVVAQAKQRAYLHAPWVLQPVQLAAEEWQT